MNHNKAAAEHHPGNVADGFGDQEPEVSSISITPGKSDVEGLIHRREKFGIARAAARLGSMSHST